MKLILIFIFLSHFSFGHESLVKTKADLLATGIFITQKSNPWPFALLSIGHNMQSYQDYSGSPYWHDGLDIRSIADQPIYAAAGGMVVNIENYVSGNHLYWEVAILDDEGFVWKYHHVAKESITDEIKKAYTTRQKISQGTLIGQVVRWPVSSHGEVYHHLHLLVVGSDGRYINPFLMMEPLADTVPPVITRIGLSKNHKPLDAVKEIKGAHGLFVEASDLVLHHKFILPPHKISYRIDQGPEKEVWTFNYLPSGKNDTDYISDFYMKGSCGDYTCRKILINLNFTTNKPRAEFNFAPGVHIIEVMVEDTVGNKTAKEFTWTVL